MPHTIKALLFDWGDTVMADDPAKHEPMVTWEEVRLVPYIHPALLQLHKDYTLCIASNARDSNAELMCQALERVHVRHLFRYAYTSSELGAAKPEPLFFSSLLAKIGLSPAECIMIGNDLQKDIAGARAAGIRTIWYCPPGSLVATDGRHLADVIVRSMKELPSAVRLLASKGS
ncbi:HAD family hydrolase [Paenibacillus sp. GD4]|jgi:HAD superfamily hydrolase (TIGR01509 family)|uniref:HAD family hydrolase n=1 Tax=Paenibacillus sp. GD4 TaxID=3068890 RepID=UPI00279658B3|nr:HAD family hydrolase [Paenibacillus sp. GD4]MDQ1909623.1 HAD family hydrolase [Paenibacillus sp. GD4]